MSEFEKKFYDALQDIFVGAKIDGQGGFVNLMRIKSGYYEKIKMQLEKNVYQALKNDSEFKEEMFEKLYSFFNRYFTQNGSICFNDTAFHNDVYEKIYTNEKDVVLFWKTHMLYYVKTEALFRDIEVEIDFSKFHFNVSTLENKKANEKKELVFTLAGVKDYVVHFDVSYAKNGEKTKTEDILKNLNKQVNIKTEQLEKAFAVFKKQSEVDYFINKDAKKFLREQFNLWAYQYFWQGAKEWDARRVNQLQMLKNIAFKIIDFISQFEDELVKIWNKPKFVRNSNYVVTLDRLSDALRAKIKKHKAYGEQQKEWQALGIDENNAKAPIDTKFFKDIESDILAHFENLDDALDGWLIKSENYQALNTILPKFKEKVQCIYIDPPFNTGSDFEYVDKFQDSTWLTLMVDRVHLAKSMLLDNGNYFVHLDENANYLGKLILKNNIPSFEIKEIVFDTNATKDEETDLYGYKSMGKGFALKKQTIFHLYPESNKFNKLFKPNRRTTDIPIGQMDLIGVPKKNSPKGLDDYSYGVEKWSVDGRIETIPLDLNSEEKIYPIGDIWSDIYSFTQSEMRISESLAFTASQKPEHLLRRIIQSTTSAGDLVLDFFSGIGTTATVAQKLGRKWIAVEQGDHFNTFYKSNGDKKLGLLGRLKNVLNGDQNFLAVDKERRPHLSKDVNWQGGGFFKYYELEQYEETLKSCKYEDGDLYSRVDDSIYEQYVFLPDEKMLDAIEIKQKKATTDLSRLYPDIDIAETLSNLNGKWIKKISKDEVVFADGSTTNIANLDYKEILPLIWWQRGKK